MLWVNHKRVKTLGSGLVWIKAARLTLMHSFLFHPRGWMEYEIHIHLYTTILRQGNPLWTYYGIPCVTSAKVTDHCMDQQGPWLGGSVL